MPRRFDIQPLDASFGAIVTGVKLAALDDETWRELHDAWLEYALLVVPGQHLARDEQIACVMVLHEPGLAARFCTHALLLFGDGETQQGICDEVIGSASLSRLYGYPLHEVGDQGRRWFVPA